ncbi:stalk domain-containing protein [Paenibacillus rubinfantis]|uniref:stalk domain-containing protein n=1 Tax=Paenibacillus rubinfantis TaxID=1720296 RepID=UPI00073E8FEB|nr:hypothetical protein [Paenibacillus rubinfantis]
MANIKIPLSARTVLIGAISLIWLCGGIGIGNADPAGRALASGASVEIIEPTGLGFDSDGTLLAADAGAPRIWAWNGSGWTARTGSAAEAQSGGYRDGSAGQALFERPAFLVSDGKGTVYVSDPDNQVIRKIKNGMVYTLAGTGKAGYRDGKPEEAQFHNPTGLALDEDGYLYVADTLNHVIRRVAPDGTVSTWAGKPEETGGYADGAGLSARFNEPVGLAWGEDGLFVADSGNQVIRHIRAGVVATYAGVPGVLDRDTGYLRGGYRNGERDQARFHRPTGIAYGDGVLYVADRLNRRVRAITPDGRVVTLDTGRAETLLPSDGTGMVQPAESSTSAGLAQPYGLAYRSGELYVSDATRGTIERIQAGPNGLSILRSGADLLDSVDLEPAGAQLQVWFDNRLVRFTGAAQPFSRQERIYLPLRELFETWGAQVVWLADREELSIRKGTWQVAFSTRQSGIQRIGGTFYLEPRVLSDMLGLLVIHDEEFHALVISSN